MKNRYGFVLMRGYGGKKIIGLGVHAFGYNVYWAPRDDGSPVKMRKFCVRPSAPIERPRSR